MENTKAPDSADETRWASEEKCPRHSSNPSEITPDNTATSRATLEGEVFHAFETLLATINAAEDAERSFRTIADACSIIKTRGPAMANVQNERLDLYLDKLRQVACHGNLRPTVRLMLLELIELRGWDWNFPETVEKFYRENIAAQNDLDSSSGKPTSSVQTPVPHPAAGPDKQMAPKGGSEENVPSNFAHAVKFGLGKRPFGDDVTTEDQQRWTTAKLPAAVGAGTPATPLWAEVPPNKKEPRSRSPYATGLSGSGPCH